MTAARAVAPSPGLPIGSVGAAELSAAARPRVVSMVRRMLLRDCTTGLVTMVSAWLMGTIRAISKDAVSNTSLVT